MLRQPLLYLSLYFKQHRARYYDLLADLRHSGDWEAWLAFFVEGVRATAEDGVETARRLSQMFEDDREKIQTRGRRAGSALRAHEVLMRSPVLSIRRVHERTGLSWPTAAAAIELLSELGITHENDRRPTQPPLRLRRVHRNPERGQRTALTPALTRSPRRPSG